MKFCNSCLDMPKDSTDPTDTAQDKVDHHNLSYTLSHVHMVSPLQWDWSECTWSLSVSPLIHMSHYKLTNSTHSTDNLKGVQRGMLTKIR